MKYVPFLGFLLFCAVVRADSLETSCLGPTDANRFLIYLHGMDSPNPSPQELNNRTILSEIASIFRIRVALPRAQIQCPTQPNLICWGWKFDSNELSAILPLILEARKNCFGKDKPVEILGFSNGGHLLTHWYGAGMIPASVARPVSMIASGSGIGHSTTSGSLENNPKLTLVIGKADQWNYDPNQTLFHELTALGANVSLVEFSGGHTLDSTALLKALGR